MTFQGNLNINFQALNVTLVHIITHYDISLTVKLHCMHSS